MLKRALLIVLGMMFISDGALAQTKRSLVHSTSDTELYVVELPGALEFHAKSPSNVILSYDIDVNANGAIDANKDVAYESGTQGTKCTSYRLTETSWTTCNTFPSRATYSESLFGNTRVGKWTIPRQELSTDGRKFGYRILFYDLSNKRKYVHGVYEFGSGARPVSTLPPSKPVSTVPAPKVATNPSGDAADTRAMALSIFGDRLRRAVASGKVTIQDKSGVFTLSSASSSGCSTTLYSGARSWKLDWIMMDDIELVDADMVIAYPLSGGPLALSASSSQSVANDLRSSVDRLFNLCE